MFYSGVERVCLWTVGKIYHGRDVGPCLVGAARSVSIFEKQKGLCEDRAWGAAIWRVLRQEQGVASREFGEMGEVEARGDEAYGTVEGGQTGSISQVKNLRGTAHTQVFLMKAYLVLPRVRSIPAMLVCKGDNASDLTKEQHPACIHNGMKMGTVQGEMECSRRELKVYGFSRYIPNELLGRLLVGWHARLPDGRQPADLQLHLWEKGSQGAKFGRHASGCPITQSVRPVLVKLDAVPLQLLTLFHFVTFREPTTTIHFDISHFDTRLYRSAKP